VIPNRKNNIFKVSFEEIELVLKQTELSTTFWRTLIT